VVNPILSSTELQMSLLLFVALAGYLLAYRIGQSAVVGIILVGILVGPSVANLVTYTDFVQTLAHLGAVVLLFTIGLEFNIGDILKIRYFVIALVGVIVPALSGYLLAKAFGYDFNAAVFVGTALTATSIAITANVLREMGKLQTEAAKAIIGAAVIDDVLALMALSVSQGLVSGEIATLSLLATLGKAVGFIAVGVAVSKFGLRQLIVRLDRTKTAARYPESLFIFAIMVAFLFAMAADYAGLSAIVGSFLAGSAFAGMPIKRSALFKEGAEYLQIIFASIFFVSLGIIMDLRTFDLNTLWFLLALVVVAILTKIVGCGLPAIAQKLNVRDSLTVGLGMVPRGEVAMIVALIGLDKGLINDSLYSAVILMSLLTTMIPPIILRNVLFRGDKAKGR
jgi:Kef-type K+ transport system membrane component KefB